MADDPHAVDPRGDLPHAEALRALLQTIGATDLTGWPYTRIRDAYDEYQQTLQERGEAWKRYRALKKRMRSARLAGADEWDSLNAEASALARKWGFP